ncbi:MULTISPECIES: acyl-CoA dehydrogenase family protein [unclassified Variovorax]|uniref:acyl-CoA dehydrogenase family protein n=1 Tax=unclassified Variovorax TaxID=663243 RepID=UPI00076C2DD4|nr:MULTISPECIES: acyl-CoA dehydrogenase family protein [unclassified Variovorax]KWT66132.1 Butyryl-CoA dehydrogenase [Variovorax sp. WDL1]PNG55843.1 (R)-benzylsuccinyl-CoA dehydrogenase [Variovorax sp. B4]PNG57267.1 (R)-benzylsuccinyl-CoA dehydrogenase [Variovorax sp. B2]VTV10387.1 (R)-benzylsuccinyl-CoA dehydrogenase [Variovorax sp. WDL1]
MFGYSDRLPALRAAVRRFVEEEAIPRESPALAHDLNALEEATHALRAKARQAGIYAPQLPAAWGGLGLSWRDRSVILEEAGRSFLAPLAMNCAPPDQPNMINLLTDGSPAQQQRYLAPLARGETRSCFAMTEPEPGAGSDPSMLQTMAVRRRGGWSISGRKWFISGAVGASFALVLARTCEGATIFIVDADNPGYRVVRNIASIDGFQIGGHGEIVLEDCLVGDDAVLGEVGRGFAYAQLRLEPARLSHCMRFIGRASRAMALAQDYANRRSSFGQPLAQLQQVQAMVADSHIDLHAARLMTWHAAAKLDANESIKHESAMVKVFVSEAVGRVADRAAQIMGALGMSEDTPVSMILREMRPFRVYDGASEVHRSTLARRVLNAAMAP